MIYTGIGSRRAPKEVQEVCFQLGALFARKNFKLRSGGSEGCDAAFEAGCDMHKGQKEIYLPWDKFMKHKSVLNSVGQNALDLAANFHPTWHTLNRLSKDFIGRSAYQLLGLDLNEPSEFLVCYCPIINDIEQGGTSQALRIARHYNIPHFNLMEKEQLFAVQQFVKILENTKECMKQNS